MYGRSASAWVGLGRGGCYGLPHGILFCVQWCSYLFFYFLSSRSIAQPVECTHLFFFLRLVSSFAVLSCLSCLNAFSFRFISFCFVSGLARFGSVRFGFIFFVFRCFLLCLFLCFSFVSCRSLSFVLSCFVLFCFLRFVCCSELPPGVPPQRPLCRVAAEVTVGSSFAVLPSVFVCVASQSPSCRTDVFRISRLLYFFPSFHIPLSSVSVLTFSAVALRQVVCRFPRQGRLTCRFLVEFVV